MKLHLSPAEREWYRQHFGDQATEAETVEVKKLPLAPEPPGAKIEMSSTIYFISKDGLKKWPEDPQ